MKEMFAGDSRRALHPIKCISKLAAPAAPWMEWQQQQDRALAAAERKSRVAAELCRELPEETKK